MKLHVVNIESREMIDDTVTDRVKAECLVLSGTDAVTPSDCAVNSL